MSSSKVPEMSLTVQVNNRRGFDIDLNVALSEEEEKCSSVIVDSDEERVRWETLVDVAEMKLCEYQQKRRGKTSLTRKTREFGSESTRKKTCYNDSDCVLVRSSRGRAVALPNKFRDSVLEPVADFPRVTRTGKRKSRLSSWNS